MQVGKSVWLKIMLPACVLLSLLAGWYLYASDFVIPLGSETYQQAEAWMPSSIAERFNPDSDEWDGPEGSEFARVVFAEGYSFKDQKTLPHGHAEAFYPSGIRAAEFVLARGVIAGWATHYDLQGQVSGRYRYAHGECVEVVYPNQEQ